MAKSVNETAEIFKALGDPTRLKIIKLISSRGGQLCVGFIAGQLGITQPAVSQHLKVLKSAGLVEPDRQGFHVHYQVKAGSMSDLGVDISKLLGKFDMDVNPDDGCEHKGSEEDCRNLNE